MKTFATVLAAAALAFVAAECPNACSGKGTCGANDACSCFDNWMGGDCSQRVCPYGMAFVDTPLGDLNHDGTVDDSTASTGRSNAAENEEWNGVHAYTECSGKGSCNRESGECECFGGFTGSACQRTTCPSDCSGHGQCFTLREIAAGSNRNSESRGRNYREVSVDYGQTAYEGVASAFDYNFWDADKNQACVCDPGFFGPDCSLRECPRGNDPLTTDSKHCGGAACQSASYTYAITWKDAAPAESTIHFEWTPSDNYNGALSTVRTKKVTLKHGLTGDDYAELLQATLHTMPNNELAGVAVSCSTIWQGAVAGKTEIECDEVPAAASATEFVTVVLNVDFSNGPQGAVDVPVPKLWAVDGSMNIGGTNLDNVVALHTYDGSNAVTYTAADGVAAKTGASPISFTNNFNDAQYDDWSSDNGATAATLMPNQAGNHENAPCSNRGLCDYSTGQCQCFAGYSREDCSVQAALAM
jgi:hypothetical protein